LTVPDGFPPGKAKASAFRRQQYEHL
jgi:hypothetical protein